MAFGLAAQKHHIPARYDDTEVLVSELSSFLTKLLIGSEASSITDMALAHPQCALRLLASVYASPHATCSQTVVALVRRLGDTSPQTRTNRAACNHILHLVMHNVLLGVLKNIGSEVGFI